MKKLIFLLCFGILISTDYTFGQLLNHTSANYHTNVATGIAVDTSGKWVTTGFRGSQQRHPYFAVSTEENEIIEDYSYFIGDEFIPTINTSNAIYDSITDRYYFVARRNYSDLAHPPQLIIFDNAVGYPVTEEFEAGDFAISFHVATIDREGLLIGVSNSNSAVKLYHDGQFINLFTLDGFSQNIIHLSNWSANRCVVLSDQTVFVYSYDTSPQSGVLEHSFNNQNFISTTALNDSTLLVLKTDGLQVWDNNLEIQQEISKPNTTHLTKDTEYIYLVTTDSIHFFNHNLVEQESVSLGEVSNYHIQDVAAQNGRIGVAGAFVLNLNYTNGYTINRPASNLFMRTYTILGADLPSDTDVAIKDITNGTINYETTLDPDCSTVLRTNLSVEVKNLGTSTLDEVIFTYTDFGDNSSRPCRSFDSYGPFYVDLAPGDSTIVQIDDFTTFYSPQEEYLNICLKAFPKLGTTEANIDNNSSCNLVTLVNSKDLKEDINYLIYPNICTNELNLSMNDLDIGFKQVAIYNLSGQKLINQPIADGQTDFVLDVSHLYSGTYYLRLEGEMMSKAKVFLKM